MDDQIFSNEAIRQGFITFSQAQEGMALIQASRENGLAQTLPQVLVRKGYMTQAQVDAIMKNAPVKLDPADEAFGQEAVRSGFITALQIQECSRNLGGKTLVDILVERGFMTRTQVDAVKAKVGPSEDPSTLADEAIRRGFVNFSQINECLAEATASGARLSQVLISKGYMTQAQIALMLKGKTPAPSPAPVLTPAPTAASMTPRPKARMLGPYEVLADLRSDDRGTLFKVRKENRTLWLRILSDEFTADAAAIERYKKEAKPKVALNHPNLVKFVAFGMIDKKYFAAMDYVEGAPLSNALLLEPLNESAAAKLGQQMAEALAAIKAQGLIHGDTDGDLRIGSADGTTSPPFVHPDGLSVPGGQ